MENRTEMEEFAQLNGRVKARLAARDAVRRVRARANAVRACKAAGGWVLAAGLFAMAGTWGLLARPIAMVAAILALCAAAWRLGRMYGGRRA